jgi:hypothetical protein
LDVFSLARRLPKSKIGAGGEGDAREQGRPGRADIGVGGLELVLGHEDVGPAQQHFRRQADGKVLAQRRDGAQAFRQQVGRHGGPHQQVQGGAVQGHRAGVAGQVHPGAFQTGLGAAGVDLRSGAHQEAPLRHVVGAALAVHGGLGQFQRLLVAGQHQVAVGHLGQQRHPGRP